VHKAVFTVDGGRNQPTSGHPQMPGHGVSDPGM
jgi:hypothetical protein